MEKSHDQQLGYLSDFICLFIQIYSYSHALNRNKPRSRLENMIWQQGGPWTSINNQNSFLSLGTTSSIFIFFFFFQNKKEWGWKYNSTRHSFSGKSAPCYSQQYICSCGTRPLIFIPNVQPSDAHTPFPKTAPTSMWSLLHHRQPPYNPSTSPLWNMGNP